jgi:MFS family permease
MTESHGWSALLRGGLFAPFALLILGVWLNAADTLVTVTVMPSVAREIGGYAYFGWATAVFLLGAITAGASAGAVAGQLGLRAATAIAGAIYSLGCILGALSPGIGVFLIARLAQGLGAGWIVGLVFVAVGAIFPPAQWARAMAATTSVWGAATLLGPLVGGVFASFGPGGWRGVFWFFAIQGVIFSVAATRLLKPKPPDEGATALPWRQILVLATGVAAIASAGLIGGAVVAIVLMTGGLGLLLLALKIDATSPHPMLPRTTRNLATAAGAGYLTIFLLEGATAGWGVYGAALVQAIYRVTPLMAGYAVSGVAVGWTLAALPIAGLKERWHGLFIAVGGGLVPLGLLLAAMAMGRAPLIATWAAATVIGAGFGLAWSFMGRRILTSLPEQERGLGAGAIPTIQMIGAAAGAAAAGALGDLFGLGAGVRASSALQAAPWVIGAFVPVAVAGWLAAVRLARLPFSLQS